MREELLKGLTEEQIAKVKACKNQEELLKLAKEEGIELSDDQLEAVSGGACTSLYYDKMPTCPYCHSDKGVMTNRNYNDNPYLPYFCVPCCKYFQN